MHETQPPSAEMNSSATIKVYEQQSSCMVTISQVTTLSPTKCTVLFPDILYYNISLNTPACFDHLWDHHQGFTLK
jgi:hypothetical protein